VLFLVAAGCRFVTTRIGDITSNPGNYLGREVTVAGEVVESLKLPLLPGGYTLRDTTGQILVLTAGQPPLTGARVRVRARVESAATIGGQVVALHLTEVRRY